MVLSSRNVQAVSRIKAPESLHCCETGGFSAGLADQELLAVRLLQSRERPTDQ